VITDHLKATYTVCIICFILHFPYRLIEYWWHECKWSLNLNYALCPVIQSSISLFISIVLWCVYKACFSIFFYNGHLVLVTCVKFLKEANNWTLFFSYYMWICEIAWEVLIQSLVIELPVMWQDFVYKEMSRKRLVFNNCLCELINFSSFQVTGDIYK